MYVRVVLLQRDEEHQTKIPAVHMALVALEHGIGCTWVSRFDVSSVARVINAPDGYFPTEILTFGYPADPGHHMPKKPLDELVFRRDGAEQPRPADAEDRAPDA